MSAKVEERHRKLYERLWEIAQEDGLIDSEEGPQLLADAEQQARLEEWEELARPYPESIFRPLSDEELTRCVDALMNSGVGAASDRLHAGWARHWSKQRIAALKAEVSGATSTAKRGDAT